MSYDASRIGIRHLAEPDIGAVIEIGESVTGAPHWSPEQYEELIHAGLTRRRASLVACDLWSGQVVGFAVAGLVAPEAELESVVVARPAQRSGVGGRLLTVLLDELRRAGIKELLLEVRASNRPAIRFYQAQNFKQIGVRAGYYADPQEDAILMASQLT